MAIKYLIRLGFVEGRLQLLPSTPVNSRLPVELNNQWLGTGSSLHTFSVCSLAVS